MAKPRKKRAGGTALLILDMLNDFDFPEADQLLGPARQAARGILTLKKRLKTRGVPVIYVNDNFGRWRSDLNKVFDLCTVDGCPGREIALMLKPEKDDYFVLKPKHSGFYSTTLELLLNDLRVGTLILTGIAGNICVLFTANDAHMRDFKVIVPSDCIASNTSADNAYALRQLHDVLGLRTPKSSSI